MLVWKLFLVPLLQLETRLRPSGNPTLSVIGAHTYILSYIRMPVGWFLGHKKILKWHLWFTNILTPWGAKSKNVIWYLIWTSNIGKIMFSDSESWLEVFPPTPCKFLRIGNAGEIQRRKMCTVYVPRRQHQRKLLKNLVTARLTRIGWVLLESDAVVICIERDRAQNSN